MSFLQNWTAGFSLDLELCEVGSWICLSFFSWCSTEVCRYTSHHCARIALFLYWRGISAKKTFNHADFVSWKIFQPIRDLIYMIVRLHVVSLRKWASWWSSWWRRGQWQWAQVNPQEWFSNIVASHTFDWLDLVLLLHMFLTFHGCSGLRSCVDHYLICGSFHIHTCRTWIPWLGWMPLWANHRG